MSEKRTDVIWLILVIVVLVGILPMLIWGAWGGYMSGMMGMMGYGWGFMSLIPLAFLVLIALGGYYIITEFTRTSRPSSKGDGRALDILKERYAKGEITREQYFKMKEELKS